MSRLLLVLLIMVSGTIAAQNEFDEKGRKHGKWEVSTPEGHLKYKGQFHHGTPVGEFRHFYPYKKLESVAVYSDSARVVRVQRYYKNGNLQMEGKYVDKKMDSTWLLYNKKGLLVKQEYYNKGVPDSTWITYYSFNGKISEKVKYEDGKKQGDWIQFFADDTLKMRAHYENDTMHGEFLVNYPSGKVYKKGQYDRGFRTGTWLILDENGDILKKVKYKNGFENVLIDNMPEEQQEEEDVQRDNSPAINPRPE